MRKIELEIPDEVYYGLVRVAEARKLTTPEMLGTVLVGLAKPDPVVELHAQGLPDRQIAAWTGLVVGTVATRRRAAGLPANRVARA